MKKKHSKRRSKKILIATLVVPIAMCLVIIIALAISFVQALMGGAIENAADAALIGAYNSQELVFSLLGVAMTVWVGLNIYNVLSKEELNELIVRADEASKITEDTYTQVLISKLRLLPADRIGNYLASRLQRVELLPSEILQEMILVEDKFNHAYALYTAGTAGQTTRDALRMVKELEKQVETHEKDGNLSRKQHDFLIGYLALRQADLSFFLGQYDEEENEKVKGTHGEKILKQYQIALNELLGVKDFSKCDDLPGYLTEDYQGLSIMANNICCVYTTLIGRDNLREEDYPIAIEAGEAATKFGTEVQPHIQAVFYRNLGVIQEWNKDMGKAIEAYYQAYKLDQKCPKILHCIASWHRKWFCMKYPFLDPRQNPNQFCITTGDFAGAAELLEKTAYWYWLDQVSSGGSCRGWPFDLPAYVRRLEEHGISVNQTLAETIETGRRCHEELKMTQDDYKAWKEAYDQARRLSSAVLS